MLDSVRARLTLWYVGLLGAMLLIFSGIVYGLLSRALYARVDESLDALVNVAEVSLTHDAAEGQSVEDAALSTVTELSNRSRISPSTSGCFDHQSAALSLATALSSESAPNQKSKTASIVVVINV